MKYLLMTGIVTFLMCCSEKPSKNELPVDDGIREIDFHPMSNLIQVWIDSGYYDGASMIIGMDGAIIYKEYFGTYDSSTQVYAASAGKWLAAATIAAVVDEGKLAWDDKVIKWLPEFVDKKGEATLRQ